MRLIAGAFALILATAGATFTVTKLAEDSHVSALRLQVSMLDARVRELQAELQGRESVETSGKPTPSEPKGVTNGDEIAIVFESPREGAQVPQFIDVDYSVSGRIPDGYSPVLFVRDPLGQYWPWGSAADGNHPNVQLGVDVDSGKRFEIGVLLTRENAEFGRPLKALPEGLDYRAISVVRR